MRPDIKTDVLIVGGGLAGLSLADLLHGDGQNFVLVEARNRLGGRIKSENCDGGFFDVGPAWFWPGQPLIAALIKRFQLNMFEQHYRGSLVFEDERGQVHIGRGYASMQGSYRLNGGLEALTNALANSLPVENIRLSSAVSALKKTASNLIATMSTGDVIAAKRIVLALPPRIAAEQIRCTPELLPDTTSAMTAIPTWMAGQAKAVAIYDNAFWRDEGLSGDAMSRRGPLAEIHDASPETGGPFALFGFIGLAPAARRDQALLEDQILDQLARLFGSQAAKPRKFYMKDWAVDPHTATDRDQEPLRSHPRYGLPGAMDQLWDDRLLFAGTEVAPQFGGYLEGALEAAEIAYGRLAN